METIISTNEIKKELYKSKVNAKFSHYTSGNLYYTVELSDGTYQFSISTVEQLSAGDNDGSKPTFRLSSDLGTTAFSTEVKASELNRWIAKAIEKNDFVKIS